MDRWSVRRCAGAWGRPVLLAVTAAVVTAGLLAVRGARAVALDPAPPVVAGSTIDRPTFPVVFEVGRIPELEGVALEALRVFRWDVDGRAWSEAPFQVDERSPGGGYLVREDGALDANDEIVALARYLGGRAPDCLWPTDAADGAVRYDVRVTDPLEPAVEGWLTVLVGAGPAQVVPTLVRWDRQARELAGTDYRVVQAGRFVGLETIELFGSGVDILDRTKLRGEVYVKIAPSIGPIPLPTIVVDETYTEESEEIQRYAQGFTFNPTKQGPVRLVLEADGSGFAYPGQLQVLAAFGRVDIPPIPTEVVPHIDRLEVSFRLSVDLSAAAVVGRYADDNVPAGVPVDGRHESVPERPIGQWRQVDTPHGGLVVVSGRPQALRALRNYYNDRGRDEPPGTGDNKAYGEFGVFTEEYDAIRRVADFLGWLVAVEPGSGVVGPVVARQLREPLQVEVVRVQKVPCAPPPTATATDTATARPTVAPSDTPTVEASATATVGRTPTVPVPSAYLPAAHRAACFPGKIPLDVVLVMDTSSSMLQPTATGGEAKLEAARRAARAFSLLVDPPHARLAVVSFAERAADETGGLTGDRAVVWAALDRLVATPGTRIEAGLAMAFGLLAAAEGHEQDRVRVVVLLSDGGGERGPTLAEASRLREAGVRVFAIGLGADADGELLGALVSRPGDYRTAGDTEDLTAIYESIGAEITCR